MALVVSLAGITCDDFEESVYDAALEVVLPDASSFDTSGDDACQNDGTNEDGADQVDITSSVSVPLAVLTAGGYSTATEYVSTVVDLAISDGSFASAIIDASSDRRMRRLDMSLVSVQTASVNTFGPSPAPSATPSQVPTPRPSYGPTFPPSPSPSFRPSPQPIPQPTRVPVPAPSTVPTPSPTTGAPSVPPTPSPVRTIKVDENDDEVTVAVLGIGLGLGVPLLLGVVCVVYLMMKRSAARAKAPSSSSSLRESGESAAATSRVQLVPPADTSDPQLDVTASTRAFFESPVDPVNPAHIAMVNREIESGMASDC